MAETVTFVFGGHTPRGASRAGQPTPVAVRTATRTSREGAPVPYLFREVSGDGLGAYPPRLRVRRFFGGLLNQLWGGRLPSATAGISQHACEIGSSAHFRWSEKRHMCATLSRLGP